MDDIAARNDITERIIRDADFHNIGARRAQNGEDDRRKRISSRPGLTNDAV